MRTRGWRCGAGSGLGGTCHLLGRHGRRGHPFVAFIIQRPLGLVRPHAESNPAAGPLTRPAGNSKPRMATKNTKSTKNGGKRGATCFPPFFSFFVLFVFFVA